MSCLLKIKNPVEYSFYVWINQFPESAHPADTERFLRLAKNVCIYNAKCWKDTEYLEKRILESKPNFTLKTLEQLLIIWENLISFYSTKGTPRNWFIDNTHNARRGFYIETGIKDGRVYEIEKEIPKNY